MKFLKTPFFICGLLSCVAIGFFLKPPQGFSQSTTSSTSSNDLKGQIDDLNQQVVDKRSRVKELDGLIGSYKQRIDDQESKQISMENELLLLDNRIRKKQLDAERAKTELEALSLEVQSLEKAIAGLTARIGKQHVLTAELIRRLRETDDVSSVEILISKKSLSAFFDRVHEVKQLQSELMQALTKVKENKLELEQSKKQIQEKQIAVQNQRKQLKKESDALEAERNFKTSLVAETKSKQSEFERVLFELKGQQQQTADEISVMESKLKDKLDSIDDSLARGDVALSWPVDPSRGITAKFHDPSYPFRNLFEHPGTDVRAYVGTKIQSAAGGYVAWNKTGRLYGNYVMVIHPGNIATVYAHLSKFVAKPDTYIDRGDTVGLSGGRPGDAGAGLSTGPHLHFEVRQNGIPVDPENFLPAVKDE